MRTKVDWRSGSKDNYIDFCKNNIFIRLTYDEWRNIVYTFNESFKEYILETGDAVKLPFGIGKFSINKKKRRKTVTHNGKEKLNLPIDWQKTKAKGKVIYNFNYATEGYFFGWLWFRKTARFKLADYWYFRTCRSTSRLLSHYLKINNKYQYLYNEWKP